MNAKEYLQQVQKLDVMIRNKQIEVEQWKAIATSSTSNSSDSERVQTSSEQQKMANAIARYIDIENEINAAIDRLVDLKKDVIQTIEQLPAIEYDVLHMKYIQFKSFEEIGEKYKKTKRWAESTNGTAIQYVQRILDIRNTKEKMQNIS